MIYLATPYSHPDPQIRQHRFEQACKVAGKLISSGELVFCPIAHSHPIALLCSLPLGFSSWERFDREMISHCSRLIVVMMEGWKDSSGVQAEVRIARTLKIPIEYLAADGSLPLSGVPKPEGRPHVQPDMDLLLTLRTQGLSHRQIARRMGLGKGTVGRCLKALGECPVVPQNSL